jgi:hypothetical protein
VIDGVEPGLVKAAWNELCQPKDAPADPDFAKAYPLMTLLKGNRFRFRGGNAEEVRAIMERLLAKRLPGKTIRARVEM